MIHLHIEPATIPMRWKDFTSHKPKRSIALDGYVREGPRFNPSGPWGNFNHHDGVSRLETRATCAQVLISLRQGMTQVFRDETGELDIHLFGNDCDEDMSLSVALIRNSALAIGCANPLLNRIVFMEDMLDTTTGAYPFPRDFESLRELMWVFNPYHRFRTSGRLDMRLADEFTGVIDDIEQRFISYIAGKGEKVKLDTRYDAETVQARGRTWKVVREIGLNARLGMFSDGITAFVAVRDRPDDNRVFTIGRSSQFIPFPIPKICARLNQLEGRTDGDLWGGGDFIIGSPRVHGSKLSIAEVNKGIEESF